MVDQYLFNLRDIPDEHKPLFWRINTVRQMALAKPGKLFRERAGSYYIAINVNDNLYPHLVSIEKMESGEWIARHAIASGYSHDDWYSDPFPTRRELLINLGVAPQAGG